MLIQYLVKFNLETPLFATLGGTLGNIDSNLALGNSALYIGFKFGCYE